MVSQRGIEFLGRNRMQPLHAERAVAGAAGQTVGERDPARLRAQKRRADPGPFYAAGCPPGQKQRRRDSGLSGSPCPPAGR